ncbi:hypothetical protein PYW07_017066 [Mythimna separata]|uniref:Uncharacterized protein n=1 Tax=Mythimna separata TaxID=271217 RepID=A0AAD7YWH7_MYTSE|nr:hypothetical protein PYW07_017066 [Mythimna separata]
MYFCEDHFDLPNDMINYMEYHIKGTVSQVRMKPGCMPSRFGCQEDRRKRTCSSTERPYILKKQRMLTIAECLNESKESCAPSSSQDTSTDTSSNIETVGGNVSEMLCQQSVDKSVQAFLTYKFRSPHHHLQP